jgi:hypothetical protein
LTAALIQQIIFYFNIISIINISAFRKLLLVSVLLLTVCNGPAQDNPDDPSPTVPVVPVDGGISLLLGVGAVLGLKKCSYRSQRRQGMQTMQTSEE